VVKPTEPDLKVSDVVGHSGEVEEKEEKEEKNTSYKDYMKCFDYDYLSHIWLVTEILYLSILQSKTQKDLRRAKTIILRHDV
jgi:hypothetical protein